MGTQLELGVTLFSQLSQFPTTLFYFASPKKAHFVFTHICGCRGFECALQKAGPELGQVLVQVESRAPIVLTQVCVEIPVQTAVLGVQRAKRRQHLLQGALGATVQLSEIHWRREGKEVSP